LSQQIEKEDQDSDFLDDSTANEKKVYKQANEDETLIFDSDGDYNDGQNINDDKIIIDNAMNIQIKHEVHETLKGFIKQLPNIRERSK